MCAGAQARSAPAGHNLAKGDEGRPEHRQVNIIVQAADVERPLVVLGPALAAITGHAA